ncbi:hypothetical protein [Planctomicrobium piriforme]|uniref:Uncharacterized protein n=1 Tax=Planctomicrobium piriforme TaxID=1576369 RepID=A0A1I3PHD8_9PLAN|nr:hypothetical protein [Planctomicrobium piriforme]SFJ20757.1 hypothetical protein SAMN05421753_116152 [Planctomicrobium piriforme]
MFGLFGKDWNVLAVIFERRDLYQVSGQRAKGSSADKARDGAKAHPRCVFWAVFDQKGSYKSGGPGAGSLMVPGDVIKKLEREIATNRTVQEVLKALETKQTDKIARQLAWHGYPPRQMHGSENQEG